MLEQILFLLLSVILAYNFQRNAQYQEGVNILECGWKATRYKGKLFYSILLLYFILYGGLRTWGNDTPAYIYHFQRDIVPLFELTGSLNWSIGNNPGFVLFQSLIKSIFGNNGLWLTLITSIISSVSFLTFYKKYAYHFTYSVYILITSTLFIFTMGAMKQTLAMSIGIWTLPLAKNKKWQQIIPLIAIAITIHPYVIFYLIIPFLYDTVWNWKAYLIVLGTILFSIFFRDFVKFSIDVASEFGDNYDISIWSNGTGVNIFRLPFYFITPVLGFVYRRKIQKEKNNFLGCLVNLSIISGAFMLLACFGGQNMFGRMAIYWVPFTWLALTNLVFHCTPKSQRRIIAIGVCCCFFLFYMTYNLKYANALRSTHKSYWFGCFFRHASLFQLFR